jgi:phosphoesterase RecJ-like protein
VRVNLRSRDDVDVAAIARRFGGGGHARAAGLQSDEDLDRLKKRLIDACGESLGGADSDPRGDRKMPSA